MKTTQILSIILIAIGCSFNLFAFDNDPQAVCQRPGTNELFIGGEFNYIVVIDLNTGAAIRQFDVLEKVLSISFTKSSDKLIIADEEQVHWLNPNTGEIIQSMKLDSPYIKSGSPYIASIKSFMGKSITLHDSEDGSPITTFTFEFDPLHVGFNDSYTELIVLGRETSISQEKKIIAEQVEPIEGYDVYVKTFLEQQSDGKGSNFQVIEIASETVKLNALIPYSSAKTFSLLINKFAESYYVLGFDIFFRVDSNGIAYPILINDSGFAYASGASIDGKTIYSGSMNNIRVFDCSTGKYFEMDMGEEDPAYAQEFYVGNEKVYLLNQDMNVHVCNPKGVRTKTLHAEVTSEDGFAVYYYNGYTKKEMRDKEAKPINAALETLGLPLIDLETAIGEENFLLGVFPTKAEADNFVEMIDDDVDYVIEVVRYKKD